ncbi:MAG: AAA family ATPase [Candidatus Limnocylindrus sp.]
MTAIVGPNGSGKSNVLKPLRRTSRSRNRLIVHLRR